VDAVAHSPRGCGSLVGLRLESEQFLIEGDGPGIVGVDGEVAHVGDGHDPLALRRLDGAAHIALRTGPAAVADVMHLEDDAARVGDEELTRSVAGSSEVGFSRPNQVLHGGRLVCARGGCSHAMLSQRLHRAIEVEALDGEAESADARALSSRRRPEFEELRSGANAQQHRGSLARLNWHPEQALIEVKRLRNVRDRQRQLTETRGVKWRRAALSDEPRRVRQCGHCEKKASAIHHRYTTILIPVSAFGLRP